MSVFVLGKNKQPLDPCYPARARELLTKKRAAVFRQFPFTVIMKDVESASVNQYRIKIDPGSKTTGIAIVQEKTAKVVFAMEIQHRGNIIKSSLESRRAIRRSRRNRKTRYRKPRFDHRTRSDGWLPPSLMSRIYNIITWINRLNKYCPIALISVENVKFDMQKMQNVEVSQLSCSKEVSGIEYQQGELAGYEVREYLLEKWDRTCAYCDKKDVPLQIEHVIPKASGGTNRISNLALACEKCNIKKGKSSIDEFLKKDAPRLKRIKSQLKSPLKDAAAVNATRNKLCEELQKFGLSLELGSGALTKYNRVNLNFPKEHWIDAACVGLSTPDNLDIKNVEPLLVKAYGHGSRQMSATDKFGFPRGKPKMRKKFSHEYQTGDLVTANIPNGKYRGKHRGRITIRQRPSFTLVDDKSSVKMDVHPKHLVGIHKADGYGYAHKSSTPAYSLKK